MVVCGIYKIVNPKGNVYIRQTVDFKKRLKAYKRKDCKGQIRLFNSLEKYGEGSHTFEIIEECLKEELNCRERFWQDEFDVLGRGGLNCTLISCKDKLRVTRMNKEVYDTFFKITYSSVNEVMRQTGKTTIAEKLNGTLFNDTSFVYKEDFDNNIFRSLKEKGKNYKPVIDIVTYVVFKTIKEAAEIYNINPSTLKNYLDNDFENKTNLRYLNEGKKTRDNIKARKKVIDTISGHVYNSISEASKITGINRCSLGGYLSGRTFNKTSLIYFE